MTRRVLLVDDDAAVREALGQTLELADVDAVMAGSFVVAKDHIVPEFDGVIVSDIRMPGRDGFHLLEYTRSIDAELPVILLTGEGDIPMAVQAMGGRDMFQALQSGALDAGEFEANQYNKGTDVDSLILEIRQTQNIVKTKAKMMSAR